MNYQYFKTSLPVVCMMEKCHQNTKIHFEKSLRIPDEFVYQRHTQKSSLR